jgi:hypothetical protein
VNRQHRDEDCTSQQSGERMEFDEFAVMTMLPNILEEE